jgi:molecular chaperone HscB
MQTSDPFSVFGPPHRYEVDLGEVDRLYLECSAGLHPDMLGEAGFSDLGGDGVAAGEFAELNQARQVLANPEQRAVALWKLWGGVEDKGLPPGFLMEMMEIRERIEGFQASTDAASVAEWEVWAQDRRAEYQRRVGDLFGKLTDGSPSNDTVLKTIKLELNAWRYVERLIEQLNDA